MVLEIVFPIRSDHRLQHLGQIPPLRKLDVERCAHASEPFLVRAGREPVLSQSMVIAV
jgi:hypothetical protein